MRDEIEALLRRGMARQTAGDDDGAAALYREALAAAPDEPDAMNLLGVVLRERGELEQASALTGAALAARPEGAVFLASHGASLAALGRGAEASELLRRAVALRPDDAVSLRNLGQVLGAMGRAEEALPPLRRAAELQPGPASLLALAHGLVAVGDAVGAADAARRAGEGAPPDIAAAAEFLLAGLGATAVPDRAPAVYVRNLFDRYAHTFDRHLVQGLGYRTPALVVDALLRSGVPAAGALEALDLGCGTGLAGEPLRLFAGRLEGVDLSPRMLDEARKTGAYDALHEADLLEFLPRRRDAFDIVAAADVLNYLGDLAPALRGMHGALRPGGVAVFSLELGERAPWTLDGARYRHHPDHASALAEAAGFHVRLREEAVLRTEKTEPVRGLMLVLARAD